MWTETETSRDAWQLLIRTIELMAKQMRKVPGTVQSCLAMIDSKVEGETRKERWHSSPPIEEMRGGR